MLLPSPGDGVEDRVRPRPPAPLRQRLRLAKFPLQLLRDLLVSRGLFDDPVIRVRFDELQLDVEDLGALFVRMAEVLRRGEELGAEVSMLKLWVSEAMQRVTDAMLELGGEQATLDAPMAIDAAHSVHIANQYFASRPATIYGGSSEIQRTGHGAEQRHPG